MQLTAFVVRRCRPRLFTVAVNGPALHNLLIRVDDPGEVVVGLQDVTCEAKGQRLAATQQPESRVVRGGVSAGIRPKQASLSSASVAILKAERLSLSHRS